MNDNHSGKRPADLKWGNIRAIDHGGLTRGALGLIVGLISACGDCIMWGGLGGEDASRNQ